MTETEWLTGVEPQPMLDYAEVRTSERKLRLFAVACCRRVWHRMSASCQAAVETVERYAEGHAAARDLFAERVAAGAYRQSRVYMAADPVAQAAATLDARVAASATAYGAGLHAGDSATRDYERGVQCRLMRCIFGNPFRPAARLDRTWLAWNDGVVLKIAAAMYESRSFDRMALLADALEEAGATNADVLGHCREPRGDHARGCFVLDILLGKE